MEGQKRSEEQVGRLYVTLILSFNGGIESNTSCGSKKRGNCELRNACQLGQGRLSCHVGKCNKVFGIISTTGFVRVVIRRACICSEELPYCLHGMVGRRDEEKWTRHKEWFILQHHQII
jgi:hypothetical protein